MNKLSYDELKKKYKGLISSQNSYQGTGYGYVVRSPKQLLEDQFVMKRYRELKREADAKQAAHMAELYKYHYLNLYKHIQETGRRPDGTPATDLEKKIAPYVWLIEPVQIGASIYAGHQYSKHNSSIPTGNGMKWRRSGQGSNSNGTGKVYGPDQTDLVNNSQNVGQGAKNQGIDVQLKFKEEWNSSQRTQALQKVEALSKANTVKTPVTRTSTSAANRYKKVNGIDAVPKNYDIDHTIDLQLGGADVISNMNPLDKSVNRSLGSQIHHKIKYYPDGTVFRNFTITD